MMVGAFERLELATIVIEFNSRYYGAIEGGQFSVLGRLVQDIASKGIQHIGG